MQIASWFKPLYLHLELIDTLHLGFVSCDLVLFFGKLLLDFQVRLICRELAFVPVGEIFGRESVGVIDYVFFFAVSISTTDTKLFSDCFICTSSFGRILTKLWINTARWRCLSLPRLNALDFFKPACIFNSLCLWEIFADFVFADLDVELLLIGERTPRSDWVLRKFDY